VIWTDKLIFEVGEDICTIYVTRRVGEVEVYKSKNCKLSFKSRRVSIEVWDAISDTKREPLVLIGSSRLNQYRYRNEILQPYGLLFYEEVQDLQEGGEKVLWMEDEVSYHNTKANRA
jgi:hypothetical protein